MPVNNWIVILSFATAMLVVGYLWRSMNAKAIKARGRQRSGDNRRSNDKRKLDAHEKRILNQARACQKSGKIEQAAAAYEKIGMMREAITILEKSGKVHQAAAILKRNGVFARAGVVYSRNGLWQDAADCYLKGKKYREAAQCAKEAKDNALAAKCFMKAGDFSEAAQLYIDTNQYRRAAGCFIKGERYDDAIEQFKEFAENLERGTILRLDKEELKVIFNHVCDGDDDLGLGKLLFMSKKLEEVILELCRKNLWEEASELYSVFEDDPGPKLLSRVNHSNREESEALARVFVSNSSFSYAGVVFEKMDEFDRAAEAFEKAGEINRAIHCYERAGNMEKLEELSASSKPSKSAVPQPSEDTGMGGRFAMSNASELDQPASKKFEANDPMESTEIIPEDEVPATPSNNPKVNLSEEGGGGNLFSLDSSEDELDLGAKASFTDTPGEKTDPAFHMSTFFQNLDRAQSDKLWSIGETFEFEDGDSILSYNDDPLGLYVVLTGQIDCYRMVGGRSTFVDSMTMGDVFGEIWLLVEHPTSVRFLAHGSAKVRILRREKFNDLLDRDGAIARKLYKHFASRLLKRLLLTGDPKKNPKAS